MPGSGRIPIIKLHDNLIVSVQTALSDQLVSELKDDLSLQIEKTSARGLVIDVSGVDLMDSYLSRSLRDIGLMARLLGVRPIICGLTPAIALTLVEMGMDLLGVGTALNLETAVERLELLDRQRA